MIYAYLAIAVINASAFVTISCKDRTWQAFAVCIASGLVWPLFWLVTIGQCFGDYILKHGTPKATHSAAHDFEDMLQ